MMRLLPRSGLLGHLCCAQENYSVLGADMRTDFMSGCFGVHFDLAISFGNLYVGSLYVVIHKRIIQNSVVVLEIILLLACLLVI